MIKTKKYRELTSSLIGNKKTDKDIWKQINDIRKQYGMSEYSFHKDVKMMQKHLKIILIHLLLERLRLHYGNLMKNSSMAMVKKSIIRNMAH